MKKLSTYFFIAILSVCILGCENDNSTPGAKVEMYLLEAYATTNNTCQIDDTTVITKKVPLILYADLLTYDPVEYTFELSINAINAIDGLQHSVNGLAFAITVDNTIIYTGYFWPAYSSASCNWVVIDPLMINMGNKIMITLGYPGPVQGQAIPDKRNDNRIISIFESDHKLIQ